MTDEENKCRIVLFICLFQVGIVTHCCIRGELGLLQLHEAEERALLGG